MKYLNDCTMLQNFDDPGAYERLQNMNIEVCVHSLLGHFKYVAVVDIDEMIVPRNQGNLPQLLLDQSRAAGVNNPIQAFIFTTAFFCPSSRGKRKQSGVRDEPQLSIISDTRRSVYIHHGRFKYIVRPEALHAV